MMLAFFGFGPILVYFLRMTLSSSLPFVTHIRVHMARTPLPSPLPCVPSFQSRKKKTELGFLSWRPLASNWCAFMQRTSRICSAQAARRFLRSVQMLMLLFQALISTRTNTYVIPPYDLLIVVYIVHVISFRYHAIYRMISVSRHPEHIPKISHDISRILGTIPNTTSRNSVSTYGGTQVYLPVGYLQLIHVVRTQDFHPTSSRADWINLDSFHAEQPYGPRQPRAFASHSI